jgi:hypothetical protein
MTENGRVSDMFTDLQMFPFLFSHFTELTRSCGSMFCCHRFFCHHDAVSLAAINSLCLRHQRQVELEVPNEESFISKQVVLLYFPLQEFFWPNLDGIIE